MPTFPYYQDATIITSERTCFSIEAATQEEADLKAKALANKYDIDEYQDGVILGDTTTDCNGNRVVPIAQNNGHPTIEIYRDCDQESLASNAPNLQS